MPHQNDSKVKRLSWDIAVPLITNRLIVLATAKIFGFAVLLVGGLVCLVSATQGNFEIIPKIMFLLVIIGAALFLLGIALMAVIFQNRWHYRYALTEDGISCETIDKKLKAANRLAVSAGLLLGSPQTVGAGLTGQSQEYQMVRWQGRFRAEYLPKSRVIILKNAWRRLMIIYCHPENYDEAADLVQDRITRHGTEKRMPKTSVIRKTVFYSIAVTISGLPLFFMADPFHVPLWIPMALLSFSLAALWFSGVFGYAVFGFALLVLMEIAADALTRQSSYLYPGKHFSRWTAYTGDDWALLFLGAVSLFVLCGFALKGIRGRIVSVLSSDSSDMGG